MSFVHFVVSAILVNGFGVPVFFFARSIRVMFALLRVVVVFGQEQVFIYVWLEYDRVRTSMNKSECEVPCRVSHVPNVCGFEDVKVCCEALWSAWGWDVS